MKTGLYIAAALIGGALFAHLLLADPGYVAIRFAGRLIEMSAITFALLVVGAYFLVRWILKLLHARQLWREAQLQRRQDRARRSLARGLLEMSEGEWLASEQTLTGSAHEAESPAAHYLVAARAADLQGATQRRDELIAKALEVSGDKRAPALIMQAEMHLKHKQLQAALEALNQLAASGENNTRAMILTARILRQTGDWEKLQELEPRLRATRGITTAFIDETVAQIYLDRLQAAARSDDEKALAQTWKELPRTLAQRPEIVVAYARAAMACDQDELAEAELRRFLGKQWDESAVLVYGELDSDEPLVTLEHAERWLPEHSEDSALLLTCARQSIRAELYGKARSYLETSIAIRPRLEAWQLLATLFEQLGERDRAVKALNDALTHAVGRKAPLPKIRARRWLDRR
ncbi:MAG TPA: heme biosynthesis HemY N-terminal domain-containing protein, partial [Povalibacter sp.]|uniref:heme biosynthesis HemY N-terminal domain-containing protein n=1 Tax=Povalibacter sp. TaxID=1962978 RepID=UPI002D188313